MTLKIRTYGANVTQESKSAVNQTGEKGQSMLTQIGNAAQSFMNKTGETLQQINPIQVVLFNQ